MTGLQIALLARTAVRLQPGQVAHRARLRAQRLALHRWPQAGRRLLAGPDPASASGWPRGFSPVDAELTLPWPGLAALASGRIELLGMVRELGDPPGWRHPEAEQLWRFHLHYWDWAWGLAADPDRLSARTAFARLWQSWQAAVPFGSGDAWLPYPAALRSWSWCGQYQDLVAGSDIEDGFVRELARHAGFLRRHMESDVGGNHLIKDLKALAGLAVFFDDDRLLRRALGRLIGQLSVQVLPDGGHYERAPAYHCQVLADLIDVAGLVQAAGVVAGPKLTGAIRRMRGWLDCVLLPDGQVPLLNDGYPVPAELLAALRARTDESAPDLTRHAAPRPAAPRSAGPPPAGPMVVLPDTGLVRAVAGSWHLLADVGAPCPDQLPAHAHADTFGCLVYVDGMPLLVDTGTSTYAPGPVREYERSTAAHSTAQVDGADSTEVWGAFRAGRRARVSDLTARATIGAVTIEAAHDGFRWLPGSPVHRRRWSLTDSGLRVDDEVAGAGQHAVTVRWYLAPGTAVRLDPDLSGWPETSETSGTPKANANEASDMSEANTTGVTMDAGAVGGAATVLLGTGADVGISIGIAVSASVPMSLGVESAPVAVGFSRTAAAPVLTVRVNADLPVHITSRWSRITDRLAAAQTRESRGHAHA